MKNDLIICTFHNRTNFHQMNTIISQGVKISVSTLFRNDLSHPEANDFFYNYVIEIENQNAFDIQLISRQWKITDSLRPIRFVEGQGVIGEQPRLSPGELFTYSSGCDFKSDIGHMIGAYKFVQFDTLGNNAGTFDVDVPAFRLEFPPKLN